MKLAFITDDSARRRSFKKRMKGLNKKLKELTVLCGIDACAIVYTPFEPAPPDVWPSYLGVQQMLAEFLRMPPKDRFRKMVNQESYILERIKKTDEELKKKMKEKWEVKMTEVMYQCLLGKVSLADLSITNLDGLGSLIDHKLSEIDSRLEKLALEDPAPSSQHSLGKQPMVGVSGSKDEMPSPKGFMDLLMGSD